MTTTAADLVGGWLLEAWDYAVDGVRKGYPMGERTGGQIIYSADGRMAALLQASDRMPFAADQFHKGTRDEREAAALTYVAYGGSFDVAGDVVTHHVELSLFPNWIGTDLVRTISWDGDRLVLTSLPETSAGGRRIVNRLVWRRARTKESPQ
jgi:hypothetical protein